MNAIDELFVQLRSQGRKAFIPFVTGGDPDLSITALLVRQLAKRGASLIEIGFPYSDPIADGPVIQASYTRALDRGFRVDDLFDCIHNLTAEPPFSEGKVPLVGMVSYSLIYRRGLQAFLQEAKRTGLSGAIVPDLPIEETEPFARSAADLDFKLIHLVTPTTPPERALEIARRSTGFLYCVSITGITGERDRLPEQLLRQLTWLRKQTRLPICVGFGISKPEHVRMLREVADGVIVGSALVRRLEQAGTHPRESVVQEVCDLAGSLADALNPPAAP